MLFKCRYKDKEKLKKKQMKCKILNNFKKKTMNFCIFYHLLNILCFGTLFPFQSAMSGFRLLID